MINLPTVNISELAQQVDRLAAGFREVWPTWMEFYTELHRHSFPHWKPIESGIWTASHDEIMQYINARDEHGKPIHPRSVNDESADFAGYRDYAKYDAQLTQIYKQMVPPYPELEQQIFDALALVRQLGDAEARQRARGVEDLFTELQQCLNAHFSLFRSSFRSPNDAADEIADCLILTAEAIRKGHGGGGTVTPSGTSTPSGTFHAKVVNVMVASPGDVAEERTAICEIIHEWNSMHAEHEEIVVLPRMWETDSAPETGDRPQAIINCQLLQKCALLVAVFWARIGTPTGKAQSGTVEEIKEHIARRRPAMIYFSSKPIAPGDVDQLQYKALMAFKAECQTKCLLGSFRDLDGFKEVFRRDLHRTIHRHFPRGATPPSGNVPFGGTGEPLSSKNPGDETLQLTPEAKALLLEASRDDSNDILHIRYAGGEAIQANNKVLNDMKDPRDTAKWKKALQMLERLGLVEAAGAERKVFSLTSDGYDMADRIRQRKTGQP